MMAHDNPIGNAIHSPFAWMSGALRKLESEGILRQLAIRETTPAAVIEIDRRRLINFGSNDYLGLAGDARLIEAAAKAHEWGVGAGASPLITGRTALHAELERSLAKFEQTEATLLFPTGFAANAGTIPALVDDGDVIFADAKNHASLIDGCRLSRAQRHIYPHADMEVLESLLRRSTNNRRRFIVSDTLFSMDGDLAPLAKIVDLSHRYDAMVLLDEAHATGVFGEHGRGILEHFGLEKEAARHVIRAATLSKALGAAGGFVCGPKNVIDWLANRARTYVFSTAAPAPIIAAALEALEIVETEPHRRIELLQCAAALRSRLQEQGWNIGRSESQIVPLLVGDAETAMKLSQTLREQGYFIPGIRPPTVPLGESLLRISLCWHHTEEMIDGLVETLRRARDA